MVKISRTSSLFTYSVFLTAGIACLSAAPSFASSQQIFQVIPLTEIIPDTCDSCSKPETTSFSQSGLSAEEFIASQKLRHEITQVFNADIWRTYLFMSSLALKQDNAKRTVKQNIATQLNALYIKSDPEEKDKMRLAWTETLGFDLWYPYFKTKEIEKWFKERVSFKFLKMKCSPKNSKGSFLYVCKKSF